MFTSKGQAVIEWAIQFLKVRYDQGLPWDPEPINSLDRAVVEYLYEEGRIDKANYDWYMLPLRDK